MPRPHSPASYNALKTAMKLLTQDLGGVEAAATTTRVGKSQLSDYSNVHDNQFVPADVLLDLETVGGTPHVTAALARIQGYELVAVVARAEHELSVLMAHLGRDVGHAFAAAAEALADGHIDEAEAHHLTARLEAVRCASASAMAWLRKQHPLVAR